MANKKFTELVLFSSLPSSTKERFLSNMSNEGYLKRIRVREEMIAEQMSIIKKRYKFPSKSAIIDLFEMGVLYPVCDGGSSFLIPTFIPAWLMSDSITSVKAVVNLTQYGKRKATTDTEYGGEVDIDVKQLYGLLQNGLVLYLMYRHENKLMNSAEVIKNAMQCYVRMVLRCLDRIFSLNTDKISTDRAAFVIACFFLINIVGKAEGESVYGLAYQCCHNKTQRSVVESVFENYEMDYTNIASLFSALSATITPLRKATLRGTLEIWTRLYGDSTLLAMENFAQFAQVLASTNVGAQLCNEVMVNSVVADYIKKFNTAFFQVSI